MDLSEMPQEMKDKFKQKQFETHFNSLRKQADAGGLDTYEKWMAYLDNLKNVLHEPLGFGLELSKEQIAIILTEAEKITIEKFSQHLRE